MLPFDFEAVDRLLGKLHVVPDLRSFVENLEEGLFTGEVGSGPSVSAALAGYSAMLDTPCHRECLLECQ